MQILMHILVSSGDLRNKSMRYHRSRILTHAEVEEVRDFVFAANDSWTKWEQSPLL